MSEERQQIVMGMDTFDNAFASCIQAFVPSHLPALHDMCEAVRCMQRQLLKHEAFGVCCEWCLDFGLRFPVCWSKLMLFGSWFVV